MSTGEHLRAAAGELEGLLEHCSGAPWRMSAPDTDGARYRALVASTPSDERRRIVEERQRLGERHPLLHAYSLEREREDYGGYLVAETCAAPDRTLMAAMRNAAEHLPAMLRAVANEDPLEAGRAARRLASALCPCDQHAEDRDHVDMSPPNDMTRHPPMT